MTEPGVAEKAGRRHCWEEAGYGVRREMGRVTLDWLAGGGCSFLGLPSLELQTRLFKMSVTCLHTIVEVFNSKSVLGKSHILFSFQRMTSWPLLTFDDVSSP